MRSRWTVASLEDTANCSADATSVSEIGYCIREAY